MTLVHPIFDSEKLVFTIRDPIGILYVRSDTELIPDSNYYISVHIAGEPISFTNKFEKVVIDGVELYKLDLFAKKLTLHMEICIYDYNNGLSLCGWHYSPDNAASTIERLTDIYYEKGEPLSANDTFVVNSLGQKFQPSGGQSIIDSVIVYNDSELAKKIRRSRTPFDPRKLYGEDVYGKDMDNVLRYLSFMQGLAYDNELKKIVPAF